MKPALLVLCVLLGFSLLFAACGESNTPTNPGGDPTVACTISGPSNAAYVPNQCTIRVGQAVRFNDLRNHPLQPTGNNPDNPIPSTVGTGSDTETVVFSRPGVYTFVCAFHPNMTGTITVQP